MAAAAADCDSFERAENPESRRFLLFFRSPSTSSKYPVQGAGQEARFVVPDRGPLRLPRRSAVNLLPPNAVKEALLQQSKETESARSARVRRAVRSRAHVPTLARSPPQSPLERTTYVATVNNVGSLFFICFIISGHFLLRLTLSCYLLKPVDLWRVFSNEFVIRIG
ncbi:hypothetical protein L596_017887 [Steinernema carpocapsae]|uniref:Uncharacterized protein n=1 Tax=Steinernema carpocapsae TaxID=34508 RepID=A0A4U5N3Q4_STECR|nr:hypothetical protein L596_017887 [Steinernema carpocapsae]